MTLDAALAEVVGAAVAPLAISVQTVTAMGRRGDIITRRAGRRLLVDSASLRPATPAKIAELADKARGLR